MRISTSRKTLGLLCLAASLALVGGCGAFDGDDGTGSSDTEHVIDGRYCGMVTTGIVEKALGTDDVTVRGDDLGQPSRTKILECTVDSNLDQTNRVQMKVNLADASPAPRTKQPAPGCTTITLPPGWGPGFSCWRKAIGGVNRWSMVSTARPTPDHTLTILRSADADGRAAAQKSAPLLLTDLNKAVEALDD